MMGGADAYLNEVKETEVGLRESIKVLGKRKTLSTEQLIDILRTAIQQAVDGQAVTKEGISWVTQYAERIKIIADLVEKLKELIKAIEFKTGYGRIIDVDFQKLRLEALKELTKLQQINNELEAALLKALGYSGLSAQAFLELEEEIMKKQLEALAFQKALDDIIAKQKAEEEAERKRKQKEERKRKRQEEKEQKKQQEQLNKEEERKKQEELDRRKQEEEEEKEREKQEEERRRLEEERQRLEEERRRKREEEERQREEKRRQEEEERRRREEAERIRREIAEKRQKELDDNPNWIAHPYPIDKDAMEFGIGCYIRGAPSASFNPSSFSVSEVPITDDWCPELDDNDELVSNVVKIIANDLDKKAYDPKLVVSIPFCSSKTTAGRENIIRRQTPDGGWEDVNSKEIQLNQLKESKHRLMDVWLEDPVGTFLVVNRPKRDRATISRRNLKITSSVDSRVSLTFDCAAGAKSQVTLDTVSFDHNQLQSLISRRPVECSGVLANSPIVTMTADNIAAISQGPNNVTVPLLNLKYITSDHKATAPSIMDINPTGTNPKKNFSFSLTPSQPTLSKRSDESRNGVLHVVIKDREGKWKVKAVVSVVEHRTDNFTVTLKNTTFYKLLLLKVEADLDRAAVEWLATLIDLTSRQKTVQFLLRHDELSQRNVQLHCVQPHKLQPTIDALTAEEFTMNQRVSGEVMVCEGQRMSLQFKGNIVDSEGDEHKFRFLANRKMAEKFAVKELDKFAQKSSEFFRGKLLVITDDALGQSKPNDIRAYANPEVLCELDLQIPKVCDNLKKNFRSPVFLKLEGVVTEELLEDLAEDISEDDCKMIAKHLKPRVSNNRVQAICSNHVDHSDIAYEILLAWAKGMERSANKAAILIDALNRSGRYDLAQKVISKQELLAGTQLPPPANGTDIAPDIRHYATVTA